MSTPLVVEHVKLDWNHRPEIVCICGSGRFKSQIEEANTMLTMAGCIVLAPSVFLHQVKGSPSISQRDKDRLDNLHLWKIDICNRVYVVDVGGYVGESTLREVRYAIGRTKRISFSEPLNDPTIVEAVI